MHHFELRLSLWGFTHDSQSVSWFVDSFVIEREAEVRSVRGG